MIKSTTINRQGVEWIFRQPIETRLEVLSNHLEICKAVINSLLEGEVEQQAGPRYCHIKPMEGRYSRWGVNPGSVRLGNQKVPVAVPRIIDKSTGRVDNVELYNKLKDLPEQKEEMVMSVLKGMSMRDYSGVADQMIDSFGLSASSISRHFVERSTQAVEEFINRNLAEDEYVALFIDGKSLAGEQMIIAMGVTDKGIKRPLDVIQSGSENHSAIKQMLKGMIGRGFRFEQGILVVIDGSKGIHKAVEDVFGKYAIIQRCQWHKREDVISYLKEELQDPIKKELQKAYDEPDYKTAKSMLEKTALALKPVNINACNSLMEGLEEILTIQRLGLYETLGWSFTTTNCIESLNSQIEKYTRKIKYWVNSDQRQRWVVMSLVDAESKLRKVKGFKYLNKLKEALKKEIKKEQTDNHFLNGGTPIQKISTKN